MSRKNIYEENYELLDNNYRFNKRRNHFKYEPECYDINDTESMEEQLTKDMRRIQAQIRIIKKYTKNHALS